MCTIHVYYFSMCPVCGHLLVCTTLVCVLFVATPMSTVSVYYFSMCVYPCGSSSAGLHMYYFSILLVCIIIVGVVVQASAQTCTGFVIVLWVFQYYTQIVSTILGVPPG